EPEAVVTYGWEPSSFYTAWMKEDDPLIVSELKGPSLNLASPQSRHAPAILELVTNVLLQDSSYIERLKRHYHMVQSKIEATEGKKTEISIEINFECKKCGGFFDCDVGAVSVSEETGRP